MRDQVLSPVGDLVDAVDSWAPERDDPAGTFTYIDLSAVDQETKTISGARDFACADAPSRARQLVRAGDVLVSTVRPNLNAVARVPGELDGATASTGFCVLRPRAGQLDAGYLFHWVRSPQFIGEMVRRATGASYPAVTDRIVCESKLPLPPLPEQQRIAAVLDKADALRAKRNAALARLDDLTKSIFLDVFGEPVTNPKGWKIDALGNLASTTSGGTPNREVGEYFGGGIPWVKSGELHQQIVTATEETLTQRGLEESSAKLMPVGTVLVAMYGATVGAVSILGIEASTNQAVCCLSPSEAFDAEYLASLLRFLAPALLAKRVGGAQPNLSQDLLRKLRVPVPPRDLQDRFSAHVAAVANIRRRAEQSRISTDELFFALRDCAFQGRL